jgi:pantoate kinase
MNQETFQILYNALVEIATADAFFNDTKKLQAIAKKALKDIAKPTNSEKL